MQHSTPATRSTASAGAFIRKCSSLNQKWSGVLMEEMMQFLLPMGCSPLARALAWCQSIAREGPDRAAVQASVP
eukprot:4351531-Amphidinium_carterae.3